MDQNTAMTIAAVILACGIVWWLICIWLFRRLCTAPTVQSTSQVIPGMSASEAFKGLIKFVVPGAQVLYEGDSRIEIRRLGVAGKFEVENGNNGAVLHMEWDFAKFSRFFRWILGLWVFLIIPITVLGTFLLVWKLAIQSENPQIRWQVLQMLQILHVLWPPLLIYFLHSVIIRVQKRSIENLPLLIQTTR